MAKHRQRKRAPGRGGRTIAPVTPPRLPLGKKLFFSAVTVLAVLALIEGGARLFATVAPNSRWEFHRQLVDTAGFPALNDVLVPDPTLFWTIRPGLDHKELAGHIASSEIRFSVSTDRFGCRRLPVVNGVRHQVAFAGDSCTFGVDVNDEQTFPALLQQRLAGTQCINLGVPGYTAYQGRRRLEQYPFGPPPEVVVIDFGFNDAAAWDNMSDAEHADQLWAERSWMGHSRALTLLGNLMPRHASAAPPSSAPRRPRLSDDEFAGEIRAIVAWCRARRAVPVLMVWPFRVQVMRDDLNSKQQALLRLADAEGLKVVNLIPVFRARGGRDLFADVIHASPAGHAVVADALEPVLRELLASRVE
jgi:lysophospholipase L1-like esterase